MSIGSASGKRRRSQVGKRLVEYLYCPGLGLPYEEAYSRLQQHACCMHCWTKIAPGECALLVEAPAGGVSDLAYGFVHETHQNGQTVVPVEKHTEVLREILAFKSAEPQRVNCHASPSLSLAGPVVQGTRRAKRYVNRPAWLRRNGR